MGRTGRNDVEVGPVTRVGDSVMSGALAGAIGGGAMLTLLCVWAVSTGHGVLEPLQWFGGLVYRDGAASAGFGSAFWGLVVHMAVSSALGVPYALLAGRSVDPMAATAGGIVYGLLAWLVLTFVVLPLVDPFMAHAVGEAPIAWFAAHVPYGASLSLAAQVRAALDARERRFQET